MQVPIPQEVTAGIVVKTVEESCNEATSFCLVSFIISLLTQVSELRFYKTCCKQAIRKQQHTVSTLQVKSSLMESEHPSFPHIVFHKVLEAT